MSYEDKRDIAPNTNDDPQKIQDRDAKNKTDKSEKETAFQFKDWASF